MNTLRQGAVQCICSLGGRCYNSEKRAALQSEVYSLAWGAAFICNHLKLPITEADARHDDKTRRLKCSGDACARRETCLNAA